MYPPSPWIGSTKIGRQLVGRADRAEQGADALEVAVAGVVDLGHERREPPALHRLRAAQRHRAVGPAVEGVQERQGARAGPVCRRASFKAASIASAPLLVKKTRFGPARARAGRAARPAGPAACNRSRSPTCGSAGPPACGSRPTTCGMAVAGRRDGDPRGEVEESVAVEVLDHRPLRPADDQRIRPRVRRATSPVSRSSQAAARARKGSEDSRFIAVQARHGTSLSQAARTSLWRVAAGAAAHHYCNAGSSIMAASCPNAKRKRNRESARLKRPEDDAMIDTVIVGFGLAGLRVSCRRW